MRFLSMIRADETTGQRVSTARLRPSTEGLRVQLHCGGGTSS